MIPNPNSQQKFGTMTRKVNRIKKNAEFDIETYKFIGKNDIRMRFNNAKDPIYYVFDVIENRPIKTLAKEFVKDSFFEAVSGVTTTGATILTDFSNSDLLPNLSRFFLSINPLSVSCLFFA